jgi:ABC-type transport system involved in multi-copper enzyme maturation permease subunit
MLNIALNTFREIIRNKFLYLIIFFAFVFIIFSISLWRLTIWDDSKIIVDFWLAMIEIFWFLSVLFVWSQLLFKEIEWKTIFLILSKPIKRYQFIIGKFFGFSLCVLLIIL